MHPKRLSVILVLIILVSDALLLFEGSDKRLAAVVMLVNLLVVVALWRYRTHFFAKSGQNAGSANTRFILTLVFWIVVAVALFFGFRAFQ